MLVRVWSVCVHGCGCRKETHRNIAHSVVVLVELEFSNQVPSRLRRVPWLVPADIFHFKVDMTSDSTRIGVDSLLQTVRGEGVGGGMETEALENRGRGLEWTRTERVLATGDEGGKTMHLGPPGLTSHPRIIKNNV